MIIVLLFIVRIIYFIELYKHLPAYKYVHHIPGEVRSGYEIPTIVWVLETQPGYPAGPTVPFTANPSLQLQTTDFFFWPSKDVTVGDHSPARHFPLHWWNCLNKALQNYNLKSRNLFSHSTGGQETEIGVLTPLDCFHVSFLGLTMAF